MAKKRQAGQRARAAKTPAVSAPARWIDTLLASPLGRQILAEALVAAAGAAASVLAAKRPDTGGATGHRRSGGALLQEAARSAAGAVTGVLSNVASDALGAAAKSMLSGSGRQRAGAAPRKPRLPAH